MKKFWWSLVTSIISLGAFAQNGATEILVAPSSNSPYILVDTLFTLDNYPATYTDVYIHFANPTASDVKAVQFRLFYDNTAFTAAVPSLKISATDQYLQYVDNNSNGYLTVTVVYTGTSSTFSYSHWVNACGSSYLNWYINSFHRNRVFALFFAS